METQGGMPKRSTDSKDRMNLLPAIQIDFNLSPNDILTMMHKTRLLGWSAVEVADAERRLSVFRDFLMLCKGPNCPFAARCPVSSRSEFIGTLCVIEMVEAYRQFASYVRSLEIDPDDHVALQMVSDLVRLHLLIRRIELRLSEEDIFDYTMQVVNGQVVSNRVINPLYEELRRLRKEMAALYDKLLASRDVKFRSDLERRRVELSERALEERIERERRRLEEKAKQATPAVSDVAGLFRILQSRVESAIPSGTDDFEEFIDQKESKLYELETDESEDAEE